MLIICNKNLKRIGLKGAQVFGPRKTFPVYKGKELVFSYIYARLNLHAVLKICVSIRRAIQRASKVGRKYSRRLIPLPYIHKHPIIILVMDRLNDSDKI